MDPKVLRALMGLAEDATDEQVTTKLAELVKGTAPPEPPKKADLDLQNASVPDLLRQLGDVGANPAIKALVELAKAQQSQLTRLNDEQKKILVERQLDGLDNEKFAVPPVVKERLREILMEAAPELGQAVFDAYRDTLKLGVIDMGERGWQRRGDEKSPMQKFLTEVDVAMSEASQRGIKMTYAEATAKVSREQPQLAQEYREESYIPSEGR